MVSSSSKAASKRRPATLSAAPAAKAAQSAGLRHVSNPAAGFRRIKRGQSFRYLSRDGRPLSDTRHLERIRSLAIPPAWTEVWICPFPTGHLQATGRDARGRKQHLYHPDWRSHRDAEKYDRLIELAHSLPRIRRRTKRDLTQRGLPQSKVLAAIVRLMQVTLIRVGNPEYRRQNNSVGLTTMRDGHARVNGSAVEFDFRGKSGVRHRIACEDERLAKVVRQCRDLPGGELFQYVDESREPRTVSSADVNAYLRTISGRDLTTKDLRTWAGTVLAASALAQCEPCTSQRHGRRVIARVVEQVAERLGNTRAICRKSYVHPGVFDSYLEGSLCRMLSVTPAIAGVRGLSAQERAALSFLKRRRQRAG